MSSPAPRIAIITSHGQPSVPPPAEIQLATVAAAVSGHLPDWEVRSATLSSKGFLEHAVEEGAVIYPFFMARGYFTGRILPQRLAGRGYRMACPFGLDPNLPQLARDVITSEAAQRNWALSETSVLFAAHGSARGPKAAEAAEHFIARTQPLLPETAMRVGYVEQAPRIHEAAAGLPAQSLCIPFFAQSGEHVREDIPEALTKASFPGVLLPPLGLTPDAASLIAAAILRSA